MALSGLERGKRQVHPTVTLNLLLKRVKEGLLEKKLSNKEGGQGPKKSINIVHEPLYLILEILRKKSKSHNKLCNIFTGLNYILNCFFAIILLEHMV